jgi:spore coat protein U-like protein
MKRIALVTLLTASILGFASHAQAAAPLTPSFLVKINLTSVCSITTNPTDITFTYTSFGAAQSPTGTFGVTCTDGLTYNMSLDNGDGLGAGSYKDSATNLLYSLSIPASAVANGAEKSHTVTGSMAANQAGTCVAGGVCTNGAGVARTLTVSY